MVGTNATRRRKWGGRGAHCPLYSVHWSHALGQICTDENWVMDMLGNMFRTSPGEAEGEYQGQRRLKETTRKHKQAADDGRQHAKEKNSQTISHTSFNCYIPYPVRAFAVVVVVLAGPRVVKDAMIWTMMTMQAAYIRIIPASFSKPFTKNLKPMASTSDTQERNRIDQRTFLPVTYLHCTARQLLSFLLATSKDWLVVVPPGHCCSGT